MCLKINIAKIASFHVSVYHIMEWNITQGTSYLFFPPRKFILQGLVCKYGQMHDDTQGIPNKQITLRDQGAYISQDVT